MSKLYIRVKKDGFIYDYNEHLAKHPGCEVVSEEIAFPERFMPPHAVGRAKKLRNRKAVLDLTTADIPEESSYTSPELAEEVSRGLPT